MAGNDTGKGKGKGKGKSPPTPQDPIAILLDYGGPSCFMIHFESSATMHDVLTASQVLLCIPEPSTHVLTLFHGDVALDSDRTFASYGWCNGVAPMYIFTIRPQMPSAAETAAFAAVAAADVLARQIEADFFDQLDAEDSDASTM